MSTYEGDQEYSWAWLGVQLSAIRRTSKVFCAIFNIAFKIKSIPSFSHQIPSNTNCTPTCGHSPLLLLEYEVFLCRSAKRWPSMNFGLDVFCQFEARVPEFDAVFSVQRKLYKGGGVLRVKFWGTGTLRPRSFRPRMIRPPTLFPDDRTPPTMYWLGI